MAIQVPSSTSVDPAALRLPGAPQLSDAGAGALARGGAEAVDVLADHQLKLQRERDTTRVFEAEVMIDNDYRQKESEFRQRRAANAFGITDEAHQWWEQQTSKVAGELENETQRALFNQSAAKRRASSLDALSGYEAAERQTARNNAGTAAIKSQVSFAAQNFNSPEAISAAREDIIQKVDVLGYFNGWDKNVLESKRLEATTELHRNVFENMLDASPTAASEYLKAHKGEIDGTVWDQLTKAGKTGLEITAAQKASDAAWASGKRGTALFDAIRSSTEGEVRERALNMAQARTAESEHAEAKYKQDLANQAETAFSQGGFSAISPSLESKLNAAGMGQVVTSLQSRAWLPQDKVRTDWDAYENVKTQIQQASQKELDAWSFAPYMSALNSNEIDSLTKLVTSRKKQKPDDYSTTTQIANEAVLQMGWGTKDNEKKGLFERRFRETVDAEASASGKELTSERKREIADKLLISGDVPRNWWLDRSAQYFEVVNTPEEAAFRVEVPKPMRQQIEASLKARNVRVDEDTVQKYYRAYLDWQQSASTREPETHGRQ